MSYRDDLEAQQARARQLEQELAASKAENERLKQAAAAKQKKPKDRPAEPGELSPELRRLAAAGRAAREPIDREAAAAEAAEKLREAAAHQRWMARGATPMAYFATGSFLGAVLVTVYLCFMAAMVTSWVSWKRIEELAPWVVPISLGAVVLLHILGRLASRAGARRELAWIAALPFPLEGYVELFSDRLPSRLCAHLELAGGDYTAKTLQDVFRAVDPAYEVDVREGRLRASINLRDGRNTRDMSAWRAARITHLAVHRLVDGALLPLHRAAGVVRVTLDDRY